MVFDLSGAVVLALLRVTFTFSWWLVRGLPFGARPEVMPSKTEEISPSLAASIVDSGYTEFF